MANYVSFTPSTTIGRAMFNFDAFGISNFRYSGTIRVAVSDTFSFSDFLSPFYSNFNSTLYTSGSEEVNWTGQMTANIQEILSIYSQFANISFQFLGDFDTGGDGTPNPEDMGIFNLTDINFTWIYRPDVGFGGVSGGSFDNLHHGYIGGAGDIFLNAAATTFAGDFSLNINTYARQVLMHELGHSLGMSHPHSAFNFGVPTLTADFIATKDLGFHQLGFHIGSAFDMYKEYFTIMSYDDQQSFLSGVLFHAHTPMILDVIALHNAYGEGPGTHGTGNDTIFTGNAGYRTYFDKGGIDTIDLSIYTEGAYLNMGVSIVGAAHLVGVGMSLFDAQNTIINGGDPGHLRWFYGEYENAIGGSAGDLLIGNLLGNEIYAGFGDDVIKGAGGNDFVDGGPGIDRAVVTGARSSYTVTKLGGGTFRVSGIDGTDTLTGVEWLEFGDQTIELRNNPPSATIANHSVHTNQWTSVGSWISYFDADGDAPVLYQFFDDGGAATSGYFGNPTNWHYAAGSAITVAASDINNTYVRGGQFIGGETMWVRVFDGADWSAWDPFALTSLNLRPTATIANHAVRTNEWTQVSNWISYSDPDGDAPVLYQFFDDGGAANSGYFGNPNNWHYAAGSPITVAAADITSTYVRGGGTAGAETMWVRVFDGAEWSDWDPFALTSINTPPTATIANHSVRTNEWTSVSSWVSYSDVNGDAAVLYQFFDDGGAANSGYFGNPSNWHYAAGSPITVAASDLANTYVRGGQVGGGETMWVRAFDGHEWSAWDPFALFTLPNTAPSATIANHTVSTNQWTSVGSWISYSDVDGNPAVLYQFFDDGGAANSGYFGNNNNWHHPSGTAITVAAADINDTYVRGGQVAGGETMWVRAFDGTDWSAWDPFALFTV